MEGISRSGCGSMRASSVTGRRSHRPRGKIFRKEVVRNRDTDGLYQYQRISKQIRLLDTRWLLVRAMAARQLATR